MYCIVCDKDNVHLMNYNDVNISDINELWKTEDRNGKVINVGNRMHNGGIIEVIGAGFGSTNDGDQFIIAICDECIKKKREDASLLYFGNYIGSRNTDDIDKSRKLYNRRKVLDELTKK